ncbi:MAG: hypothetical protein MR522_09125 [Trueperella sp.]|uniref:hypothetical protein n=1 Tax=Trueperella sp. TaxID=2699835 RepID=UPI0025DFA78A|nr:hypothetical protein [Trueperella sp.]MCI7306402.1 hypothetical protein [Trueperella sp.]
MAETYLHAMGLHGDWGATVAALENAPLMSIELPSHNAHISAYEDPSGWRVGLIDIADRYSTETFAVLGAGGHTVDVWQVLPGIAHVDLLDADGELFTRFLAFVDDPHMYPWYALENVGEPVRVEDYQLGAIAVDLKVYDSVDEWEHNTEPLTEDGLRMGPSSIVSPWLFALYSGEAEPADVSPVAMFTSVIKEVEVVTNALTGLPWQRAVADCGFECALAFPADHKLHPGNVVDGKAFITGSTSFWSSDPSER